jgi:hypothetical protein
LIAQCEHGGALLPASEAFLEDRAMIDTYALPYLEAELHKHPDCACVLTWKGEDHE